MRAAIVVVSGVGKTMHWRNVPGVVHIVVHTDESPSDEDWNAYMADVLLHVPECKRVLVYTRKAGPSTSQRASSNEVFNKLGQSVRMAVMTGSRLTQGIVTALSWVVGTSIKAFSTRDFERAADSLELDPEQRLKARVVLRQLARAAGTDVDAFADESGRFQRQMKKTDA